MSRVGREGEEETKTDVNLSTDLLVQPIKASHGSWAAVPEHRWRGWHDPRQRQRREEKKPRAALGAGKLPASASGGAGAHLGGGTGAWPGCIRGQRWLLWQGS